MSSGPRIAPGSRQDVGFLNWAIASILGLASGTERPRLFLIMGRHRRLLRGWLRFASHLMPFGSLPRRETELVILRVAHLRGCRYELDHHIHLGTRAGVTAADVERVVAGPDAAGWSDRERTLLAATDGLVADGDLADDTWAALRGHLEERLAIELVLLVGHYVMLATFLNTLRVEPDRRRSRRHA